MTENEFELLVEIMLTEPGDVWDLFNMFLTRHSQLERYAKRAPTDADRAATRERADRWFGYMKHVEQYYLNLEHKK